MSNNDLIPASWFIAALAFSVVFSFTLILIISRLVRILNQRESEILKLLDERNNVTRTRDHARDILTRYNKEREVAISALLSCRPTPGTGQYDSDGQAFDATLVNQALGQLTRRTPINVG